VLARPHAPITLVPVDPRVFERLAAVPEPMESQSMLMLAELQRQQNMQRIVEQRQTRWLREHILNDDDEDE